MNRGKNSSATKRKRRPYCACGHWRDNHEDHGCCIFPCPCEGYVAALVETSPEHVYVGPRAVPQKSKGARPEA